MRTIRLQATIQETDMPYIERFLKGISAEEVSFEEDDFYYELSQEDLQAIEIGREQIKNGLFLTSEEVFEKSRKKRDEKWKR